MSDLPTPHQSASSGSGAPDMTLAPALPEKAASRWEDFIDIFYMPAGVFARRMGAGFGIPMLVVTLALGTLFIVNSGALQPMMDAEFQRGAAAAMAKNPKVTPEMMAQGRVMGEKVAKVASFIVVPVTLFLIGLVLWLVGKLFGARQTLTAAIMVASYAYVPRIIESVLAGLQGLLLQPDAMNGRYRLSLGAGRFFDPDTASPLLLALLGRLDLFTIWITVLLAIGLSVTGKISRQQAAIAAVIVWLLGALPGVLQALSQARA